MTESISEKPGSDIREGTSVTHWGVVETIVVDGKISKLEPVPEDRRPSPNLNVFIRSTARALFLVSLTDGSLPVP